MLRKGERVLNATQEKTWLLSFSIKPFSVSDDETNILQVTNRDDGRSSHGGQLTLISFLPGTTKLKVCNNVNNTNVCFKTKKELSLGEYTRVTLSQTLKAAEVYEFLAYVGKEEIYATINTDARNWGCVWVYMSSPWFSPAHAYVKDLQYRTPMQGRYHYYRLRNNP